MISVKQYKNKSTLLGKANQDGFTLVDLIAVILLLGILSAVALPRVLDITHWTHDALVDVVFGGLNTGLSFLRVAYGVPVANMLSG